MKAILLPELGGPEVLHYGDIEPPSLQAPGDVLVRVRAAGINPIDTKLRSKASALPLRLPAVLGCDGAGVIERVGADVRDFKAGDEVYYCQCGFGARLGNYAQYAVVDQRLLAHKPANLGFEEAAAIPLALITAWESLYDHAQVQAHERVLVHAGAGGVGHLAIQLARLAGAEVCATVGSDASAQLAESLGAALSIHYKDENFNLAVLDWTEERGVDVALDTVGGEVFEHSFSAVRYFGTLVTLLQPASSVNWTVARQRNLKVCFELMLTPCYLGLDTAIRHQGEILRQAAPLFEQGQLKIHVGEVFPLAEAAAAHRRLEAGGMQGKLVLRVD